MLVLSRKAGEKISIGDQITIVVNRIAGNRVAIGIQAPDNVRVVRGELERFVDEAPARDGGPGKSVPAPSVTMDDSSAAICLPRHAR
jgi:carbon storage regulator